MLGATPLRPVSRLAYRILGLIALGLAGRKFGQGLLPVLRLWDIWRAWKT